MTDTPIPSLPTPTPTPTPTPALPAAAQPSTVVNQTSAGVLDQNFAALLALNTTQKKKRKSKAHLNAMKMRGELWPELDTSLLWDRTVNDGYSSIPRTLSLITNMIDDLAKKHTGKSAAAGKTYFALWCRVWDENMLTIENESVYAIESGYSGERNVTTWRQHMKVLQELGFIDTKEGAYGPYNFVLIYNPYLVLKKLKPQIPASYYQLLLQRAIEIGADGDLIDKPNKETK